MRRLALCSLILVVAADCESPSPKPPAGEPYLEMYNVQDLVSCISNFGNRCDEPDLPDGCKRFEESIKRALPPVWDEEKGISLVIQTGLLIVRAPEQTHEAVVEYLKWRRMTPAGR